MSYQELSKLVETQGLLKMDGHFEVVVECFDARENFGRVEVKTKPVGGNGSKWVRADRYVPFPDGSRFKMVFAEKLLDNEAGKV